MKGYHTIGWYVSHRTLELLDSRGAASSLWTEGGIDGQRDGLSDG